MASSPASLEHEAQSWTPLGNSLVEPEAAAVPVLALLPLLAFDAPLPLALLLRPRTMSTGYQTVNLVKLAPGMGTAEMVKLV